MIDVDRPFEFRVFLAAGESHRQRDGGGDDDDLPAPERERGQGATEQAGLTGALDDVVGRREQRAATEGEDHRVGMQRAQAAVAQPCAMPTMPQTTVMSANCLTIL
ncbi:hypothetical protein G6F68_018569 [Rhizopus microsporus]|nr:hypothetical protein G6F68_018569 [Rhizopus microsporus]